MFYRFEACFCNKPTDVSANDVAIVGFEPTTSYSTFRKFNVQSKHFNFHNTDNLIIFFFISHFILRAKFLNPLLTEKPQDFCLTCKKLIKNFFESKSV